MADALERDLPYQRLPLMLSRDCVSSQFLNVRFRPVGKLAWYSP